MNGLIKIRAHHIDTIYGIWDWKSLEAEFDPFNFKIYGPIFLRKIWEMSMKMTPKTVVEVTKDWDVICEICPLVEICKHGTWRTMREYLKMVFAKDYGKEAGEYKEEYFDLDKRDQDVLDKYGLKEGQIIRLGEVKLK